jgi:trigger factor
MAVTVETLEKLERRITLTLAAPEIGKQVESRLKNLARTVKADGFRPGKVPMSVVAQRYGYSVQYEVMNDELGKAFSAAANEAKLRVAGTPRIAQKEDAPEGMMAFDATFEVYPEVKLPEMATLEVERVSSEVTDAAIERTLDILRKQRRTFAQRPAAEGASETDRVTIDFEGKIDGEPFEGGKADAFSFIIGEGQMLEQFDKGVRGMKVGESKTFPLSFPADYQSQAVAGKEADFLVTMKKIETANLPSIDDAFAKTLGIADASVEGLRADVKKNLEREVGFRVKARNKAGVMEALAKAAELEVPKALVQSETERMVANVRQDMKQRGMKDWETAPIPDGVFDEQASKRVRLGLVVSELVRSAGLQAKPEQLQKHIEEVSQSYEKPAEVVRYYFEALVIENNVAEHVLAHAKVTDKVVAFDELMNA